MGEDTIQTFYFSKEGNGVERGCNRNLLGSLPTYICQQQSDSMQNKCNAWLLHKIVNMVATLCGVLSRIQHYHLMQLYSTIRNSIILINGSQNNATVFISKSM